MAVEIICETCGKHFSINPYRIKIGEGKFCSRKCVRVQRHEIVKTCLTCGKEFFVVPSQDRRKYCSYDCAYKYRKGEKNPRWVKKITINCQTCGNQFEVIPSRIKKAEVKFCSTKCAGEANKLYPPEKRPNWQGGISKIIKLCQTCNKQFEASTYNVNKGFGSFCSRSCVGKTRTGNKNSNWNDGSSFKPYCPKFNERLKERIRERDNRTCQLCGEEENIKKLDCHHIHYDRENCYPDLISLCHICNSKVNGNRKYYEELFMNKLNENGLLLWSR